MPKIQYCRCRVNLAGQNCHTVIFDEFSPVTWPEVQVLMQLHGEENVMDISPVGIGETYPTTEKNRLTTIYGPRVVETCFPGRAFRMDYMMTADENLPRYEDGKPVKINGEDDHDDGEDETARTGNKAIPLVQGPLPDPVFKPGRHKPSPTTPTAA